MLQSSLSHIPAHASLEAQRSRFAAARSVLTAAIAAESFPGAAYGLLFEGSVIALDSVGRFTYDADSPEVLPGTVFDLASVTKVVATTAAAMLMYQRGQLDLDMRVGDLLPGFVIGHAPGDGKERVTLRMLLAHSSGLPGYERLYQKHQDYFSLLRACLRLPLEALPMERAEYSDIGFILLGKALEVIAGEPLAQYCRREIFAPLGLTNTGFCPPQSVRHLIPPTSIDTFFRHRKLQGEVQDEHAFVLGGCGGHAGLFSNVQDLLTFSAAVIDSANSDSANSDPANSATDASPGGTTSPLFLPNLFHSGTINLFASRQTEPAGTSRALGWDTPSAPSSSGKYFGSRSIGHLGYAGTSLWIDLDRALAVALLTNRTWPDRANDSIRQVRPAFHDALLEAIR
jgi:CubicO group peptidase (beta-lactamase class C family)